MVSREEASPASRQRRIANHKGADELARQRRNHDVTCGGQILLGYEVGA